MLLPQSAAFAALKNRLNSVSAIGYLHIPLRTYVNSSSHTRQKSTEAKLGSNPQTSAPSFDRPGRLKPREDGGIKWAELLEKFKNVQEKVRRAQKVQNQVDDSSPAPNAEIENVKDKALPDVPKQAPAPPGGSGTQRMPPPSAPVYKSKSGLGNLGRFAGGVAGRKGKK